MTRLQNLGLLDRADPNHLRAYVAAVHQHQEATSLIDRTAVMIERNGQVAPNQSSP